MNKNLYQVQDKSLLDDKLTYKKVELNLRRNKEQDNTEALNQLAEDFNYENCKDEYWNPEEFSLLYGSPLWDQASAHQRIILNQLYWVGYYSQIISAEIATIYLNQTAAAGLYQLEDFKIVCDTLDLESMQERAHINSFKVISEQVEEKLFGERLFTYPMKNFATETMIFQDTNKLKEMWKKIQINFFALLSSNNAFLASQYLTIRGLRTLNGKIVQHQLSQYYVKHADQDNAPIPAKVSYHHFLDESYHFNSSTIIGHDVIKSLKAPTAFERYIANLSVAGCQKDHFNFNSTVNGIFWYEPAIYKTVYKILTSTIFNMKKDEALNMMEKCFCRMNQGIQNAYDTHKVARESYIQYVHDLDYLSSDNKKMSIMCKATIDQHLNTNINRLNKFKSVA